MYISRFEVQEDLLVDSENGATVVGCFLQLNSLDRNVLELVLRMQAL